MIGTQETQGRNASAPDPAEYCNARNVIGVVEAAAAVIIGDVT